MFAKGVESSWHPGLGLRLPPKQKVVGVTRLNQIIAIEPGVKTRAERAETDLYHKLDKKQLFSGLARTYTPKDDEDGDVLPPEGNAVQLKADEIIDELQEALARLIDLTATKDRANQEASADIVVDGQTLASAVPVTTLLFLGKEVEKLAAFIGRLPILDPAQRWDYDANVGAYAAPAVQTVRTKKVPRNHVLAEATKEHPAQVQVYHEDIIVGSWTKVEFSGAMPADNVRKLTERLEKLRLAIKFAREEANSREVTDVKYADALLGYLFKGGETSG